MIPPVRVYDSMRGQKVAFEPLVPGKVSMYVCGVTPYAAAHIGHAYSAICFDLIRRSLQFLGYQVTFVRNVTDVDDKIIKASHDSGEDALVLSNRFTEAYNRDMAMFGVAVPDLEPRVSTHIAQIIALIQRLIDRGKAYVVDGDVYFEIATFPGYGKLSGISVEDLIAGERIAVDERKRAAGDFALWKSAKPGEPQWDSPWGKGRPGWHIECSAMCWAHLGESFDLHGGGRDLVFPHHENEIAQSQGAFGEQSFARYWMHNGLLNLDGTKISKSLGNVLGCQLIADAVGPEALRFFFVNFHYRSPIEFELVIDDGKSRFPPLEAADRRLSYFYETLSRIDGFVAGNDGGAGAVLPESETLVPAAREALADDFNAAITLAALGEAAKLANKLLDEGKGIDKQVRRRTLAKIGRELREVGHAIGILAQDPASYLRARRDRLVAQRGLDVASVQRLLDERAAARTAKDWTRADAVRNELTALGVEVLDTPQGTDWRIVDAG